MNQPNADRVTAVDHIGVAVRSIDEAAALYESALGLVKAGVEEVPGQGVRVLKLDAGGTHIELLEPLVAGEGPIAKFLDKRGPGIHHICLQVPDIDASVQRLRAAGYRTLSDMPQQGADGCLVMFLHPKETFGTLLELSQPARQS